MAKLMTIVMKMTAKMNVQVLGKVEALPDLFHHPMTLDSVNITAQHSIGDQQNELITVLIIVHGLETLRLIAIFQNRQ